MRPTVLCQSWIKLFFLCFYSPKTRLHLKKDRWSDAHSVGARIKLTTVGRFSCCRLVDLAPRPRFSDTILRLPSAVELTCFESLWSIFWVSVLKGSFKKRWTSPPRPWFSDSILGLTHQQGIFVVNLGLIFWVTVLNILNLCVKVVFKKWSPRPHGQEYPTRSLS